VSSADFSLRLLNEAAAGFFARSAAESWVPAYLASRGFDGTDIFDSAGVFDGVGGAAGRRWQIGYAPKARTALSDHLRELGYSGAQARAAGLARESARGALIDVFRDRAMFPVRSMDGTVAGFIGRARPGAGAGVPAYLNTATTPLFYKGAQLFGLYECLDALSSGAWPVIVEGPLDAIAITLAGGGFAGVALCGTALTSMHVDLLSWASDLRRTGLIVAFDADVAGRAAAVRAYPLLRAVTDALWTVSLPTGSDPAEVLRTQGADGLAAVLRSSLLPLPDLVIDARLADFERWLEFTDGTFAALRAVAPLIAGLPPGEVARQVARTAGRLGLTHAEVTNAVTAALLV
jgi:DNA primase catalytic core